MEQDYLRQHRQLHGDEMDLTLKQIAIWGHKHGFQLLDKKKCCKCNMQPGKECHCRDVGCKMSHCGDDDHGPCGNGHTGCANCAWDIEKKIPVTKKALQAYRLLKKDAAVLHSELLQKDDELATRRKQLANAQNFCKTLEISISRRDSEIKESQAKYQMIQEKLGRSKVVGQKKAADKPVDNVAVEGKAIDRGVASEDSWKAGEGKIAEKPVKDAIAKGRTTDMSVAPEESLQACD